MIEPLLRNNLPRLQGLYDRCPTPARNLLTSARGWFLTRNRYSSRTLSILAELRAHESWTSAQISQLQLNNLTNIVDHARRTVPFYSTYPRQEIRTTGDLRAFPILDRETVLRNQERLISQSIPMHERVRAGTTGTTGTSLRVAYTEKLAAANWAFLLRQWAWAGIQPRHRRITLQGPRIVPASRNRPPYWTHNLPERQILMSIFHVSQRTAPVYLHFLERHAGYVLEGFPSVLAILADFALTRGLRIPMQAVFTSGEPLYLEAREKLQAAFGAPVFDTYGMTEYCGLIQQCERGLMHVAPEYGFLEILDRRGEPAMPGELVWTGFLNEAMPLIRYRIGDRGRREMDVACACGRAFPVVLPTITRESDILYCPDGRVFSPRALNQLLKESESLRFCQFIHDRADRVVVRAVVRSAEAKDRAAGEVMQIRSCLQKLLGTSMQVTARLASEPLARPGGKIPLIVNQVALNA
jgi:phenylacetate-CoA ligase